MPLSTLQNKFRTRSGKSLGACGPGQVTAGSVSGSGFCLDVKALGWALALKNMNPPNPDPNRLDKSGAAIWLDILESHTVATRPGKAGPDRHEKSAWGGVFRWNFFTVPKV